MTWDDSNRTLIIGARRGSYNGMLQKRSFVVTTADGQGSKTIEYTGKKLKVRM